MSDIYDGITQTVRCYSTNWLGQMRNFMEAKTPFVLVEWTEGFHKSLFEKWWVRQFFYPWPGHGTKQELSWKRCIIAGWCYHGEKMCWKYGKLRRTVAKEW